MRHAFAMACRRANLHRATPDAFARQLEQLERAASRCSRFSMDSIRHAHGRHSDQYSAMYPAALPTGNVLALIGPASGGTQDADPSAPARSCAPDLPVRPALQRPCAPSRRRVHRRTPASCCSACASTRRLRPRPRSKMPLMPTSSRCAVPTTALYTNALEVKLEAGASVGSRVSVRQNGAVYSRDNIGANVLSVQYTGSEATATVTVAAGKPTLAAPTGTVAREYDLAEWPERRSAGGGDGSVSVRLDRSPRTDRHARFLPGTPRRHRRRRCQGGRDQSDRARPGRSMNFSTPPPRS
ncbi:MAG: hypothetical protein MZV65_31655 [Chromatiales bacterium]|nr:hypothetical protein [Chromatiales bacterium]